MLSPLVAVAVRAALIQWSIEYGQEKAPDDSGAFDWVPTPTGVKIRLCVNHRGDSHAPSAVTNPGLLVRMFVEKAYCPPARISTTVENALQLQ